MLASLKTESFVLSTLLKLHPKTTAGGRFYQRRDQETEKLAHFKSPVAQLLCPLASTTHFHLFQMQTPYWQTRKLKLNKYNE